MQLCYYLKYKFIYNENNKMRPQGSDNLLYSDNYKRL